MGKGHEELQELGHEPVPGYKKVFYIADDYCNNIPCYYSVHYNIDLFWREDERGEEICIR